MLVVNQRLRWQMHCDFCLCMHQCLWLVESEKLLFLQFAALDSLNLPRIELFNSVYYQFSNSISASEAAIVALHTFSCHISKHLL